MKATKFLQEALQGQGHREALRRVNAASLRLGRRRRQARRSSDLRSVAKQAGDRNAAILVGELGWASSGPSQSESVVGKKGQAKRLRKRPQAACQEAQGLEHRRRLRLRLARLPGGELACLWCPAPGLRQEEGEAEAGAEGRHEGHPQEPLTARRRAGAVAGSITLTPVSSRAAGSTIVDYGMGNLRSVDEGARARRRRRLDQRRSGRARRRRRRSSCPASAPSPRRCARSTRRGLDEAIRERAAAGVPLLGICLGMQLLFESLDRARRRRGPRPARRARSSRSRRRGLKLPHIGWSHLRLERESPLTAGIADGEPFYFVHSLRRPRPSPSDLIASAEHGERFAARRRPRQRLRHPVPPREVERARACGCSRNFAALAAPPARRRRGGGDADR